MGCNVRALLYCLIILMAIFQCSCGGMYFEFARNTDGLKHELSSIKDSLGEAEKTYKEITKRGSLLDDDKIEGLRGTIKDIETQIEEFKKSKADALNNQEVSVNEQDGNYLENNMLDISSVERQLNILKAKVDKLNVWYDCEE